MRRLTRAMILFLAAAAMFSGCHREQIEPDCFKTDIPNETTAPESRTVYFVLVYDKQKRNVISCSEEEFLDCFQGKANQAIKAVADYFEGDRFTVTFEWMCSPTQYCLNIEIGNISEADNTAFLQYQTECRGTSVEPDLTHHYVNKARYNLGQRDVLMKGTGADPSSAVYKIDFSKAAICPYYTEPAISSGIFLEHSVSWKEIKFICSGHLADPAEHLSLKVSV
jgi:hypothetical protein